MGCQPSYSFVGPAACQDSTSDENFDQGCFPLPGCSSFKEKFKNTGGNKKKQHRPQPVIAKRDFKGDPEQARFTSDFHHIAPHAKVDSKHHQLLLKTKRDQVMTRSGGGFGATVSSTRWSSFGTFSAKLKSGATGPGIVTAMMLSNPELGEEILIELVGRDPKIVATEFYRRQRSLPPSSSSFDGGNTLSSLTAPVAWGRRRLKDMQGTLHEMAVAIENVVPFAHSWSFEASTKSRDTDGSSQPSSHPHNPPENVQHVLASEDEQIHELKKSAVDNYLVYTIEWTKHKITWSVDGKTLRVLKAKDVPGGLPVGPMQLQLTIWDGGYSPDTVEWAGGPTDYGATNRREYVTSVEWIKVKCVNSKEESDTWPGPLALHRLKASQTPKEGLYQEKTKTWAIPVLSIKSKNERKVESSWIGCWFDRWVTSLLRWNFFLVVVVALGVYFTNENQTGRKHVAPFVKMEE
ncbi:hypothetical protein BGZ94_007074 [Podila epigama]|nr:hypothetical protein BGZ94_007074 [Podila epigama]